MRVPGRWDLDKYREGKIRASTGKGRIPASIGNGGSERVPEKVGSGRVSEMWDPGEYREGKIRASTRKCRIRASIENVGSGRVPGR